MFLLFGVLVFWGIRCGGVKRKEKVGVDSHLLLKTLTVRSLDVVVAEVFEGSSEFVHVVIEFAFE
jgi:hypothetical protein